MISSVCPKKTPDTTRLYRCSLRLYQSEKKKPTAKSMSPGTEEIVQWFKALGGPGSIPSTHTVAHYYL